MSLVNPHSAESFRKAALTRGGFGCAACSATRFRPPKRLAVQDDFVLPANGAKRFLSEDIRAARVAVRAFGMFAIPTFSAALPIESVDVGGAVGVNF